MRVLFFLVTFVSLSIQFEDPCAGCNLPTVLPSGASSLCGDFPAPSHHSSMLRSSDATACYLSITGCDLYNVIAGGVCYVDNFNLKALLCINGTFSLPIPSSASYIPVHSIRTGEANYSAIPFTTVSRTRFLVEIKVLFVLIALALIGYSQARDEMIVCSQCEFPEVWNHTESAGGCSALPAYIGNTVMIRHAENDYCFLTLGGCLSFEYLLTDGTCVESSPIRPHFCMGATSCSFQYTLDIGIVKVRCRQEAV